MITIDGSKGEGGGQMLRTALALSCVMGEPVEIDNIRAGRSKPGLRPQHSIAVTAAQNITDGKADGNKIGSTRVAFEPGKVVPGSYRFDIGTAGSTLLVLQTIYLPLALAEDESRLKIEGGTHVPWSPPFEHSETVLCRTLQRAGIDLTLKLLTAGFYPTGGGRIDVKIKGRNKVEPIQLTERGDLKALKVQGAVANLHDRIGERMAKVIKRHARDVGITGKTVKQKICRPPCNTQGAYVFLETEYENVCAGFVGLGELGKRAEIVADEAWEDAVAYITADEPIEPHLADQLLLPLAFANGQSEFSTTRITSHLMTNAAVIETFGAAKIDIEGEEDAPGTVKIEPEK